MISEQDLLLRARQLDPCALEEIYDLYSPRLYRYAVRLLGDACTAEDCVAETFGRFLQAIRTRKGPSDFLQAYLYRTIHNLVVDHYRRQSPLLLLNDDSSGFGNIEETADQNIRKLRVRAAIHELTSDQQQVIALKFLEGWENEEIAHILNKPVGAVKSLQHRALASLQKILLNDEVEHVER
ncbi:MAG TPA: sigma-70 family RNA polymerase sigma factor [Anaerolineales bacterium]|nr:sigma-70 family RNA polymerase sigma factor [Anaerolineales bacterium]